jgi:SnoaL-like domain
LTTRSVVRAVVAAALIAAAAFAYWRTREGADERQIRQRIEALRDEVNASTKDGLGTAARATQIGSYFTDDAVVDFGDGAVPIRGRDTLMDMAARLQPRTAAFRLDLDDIGIDIVPGGTAADVLLTASFVRRVISTGEESRDAREFALVLTKLDGTWRISQITAIDTLR